MVMPAVVYWPSVAQVSITQETKRNISSIPRYKPSMIWQWQLIVVSVQRIHPNLKPLNPLIRLPQAKEPGEDSLLTL